MSKTQAALQRRLGRLSMLVDLTAQFIGNSALLRQLRNEMAMLKDSALTPAELQRSVGRATVLVEEISKELPTQKEMMNAMLKELALSSEIISRIDDPVEIQAQRVHMDGGRPPVTSRRP